ncbi:hypothetical protein RP20_CCG026761 [Aedes albopictus]|nr:hypothetical protein RP20_CCG026761 [Aedes albopictus]
MLEEITKQGSEKPSPIQAKAWPVLLKGEDLIEIDPTGSRKTPGRTERSSPNGGGGRKVHNNKVKGGDHHCYARSAERSCGCQRHRYYHLYLSGIGRGGLRTANSKTPAGHPTRLADYHDECDVTSRCPTVGSKLNAQSGTEPKHKVIIFCSRKTRADDLDREQADREQTLEDIKSGDVWVLFATDVTRWLTGSRPRSEKAGKKGLWSTGW